MVETRQATKEAPSKIYGSKQPTTNPPQTPATDKPTITMKITRSAVPTSSINPNITPSHPASNGPPIAVSPAISTLRAPYGVRRSVGDGGPELKFKCATCPAMFSTAKGVKWHLEESASICNPKSPLASMTAGAHTAGISTLKRQLEGSADQSSAKMAKANTATSKLKPKKKTTTRVQSSVTMKSSVESSKTKTPDVNSYIEVKLELENQAPVANSLAELPQTKSQIPTAPPKGKLDAPTAPSFDPARLIIVLSGPTFAGKTTITDLLRLLLAPLTSVRTLSQITFIRKPNECPQITYPDPSNHDRGIYQVQQMQRQLMERSQRKWDLNWGINHFDLHNMHSVQAGQDYQTMPNETAGKVLRKLMDNKSRNVLSKDFYSAGAYDMLAFTKALAKLNNGDDDLPKPRPPNRYCRDSSYHRLLATVDLEAHRQRLAELINVTSRENERVGYKSDIVQGGKLRRIGLVDAATLLTDPVGQNIAQRAEVNDSVVSATTGLQELVKSFELKIHIAPSRDVALQRRERSEWWHGVFARTGGVGLEGEPLQKEFFDGVVWKIYTSTHKWAREDRRRPVPTSPLVPTNLNESDIPSMTSILHSLKAADHRGLFTYDPNPPSPLQEAESSSSASPVSQNETASTRTRSPTRSLSASPSPPYSPIPLPHTPTTPPPRTRFIHPHLGEIHLQRQESHATTLAESFAWCVERIAVLIEDVDEYRRLEWLIERSEQREREERRARGEECTSDNGDGGE